MKNLIKTGAAAKLLGLHPDTVRRRAKAGKVPGARQVNGTWMFDPTLLGKKLTLKNVTNVVFVLDRSGSMGGLYDAAKENLEKYAAELLKAANVGNEYYVSIINFDDTITTSLQGRDIRTLSGISGYYLYPHGQTRLFDAVAEAISQCQKEDDGKKAFLVYVVTDGYENASKTKDYTLRPLVETLTKTDRYTFVLAGPQGCIDAARRIGITDGNVTSWEQTVKGTQVLGATTVSALSSYTATRSTGVTSTNSFYANVNTPAGQFANQLDDKLDDISTKVEVKRVETGDPVDIRKFCDKKFGGFVKGEIFYQLTKTAGEKVQDYKKVIIQDTATGNFYLGWKAAMKLLGIPTFKGTVKIKPGTLGEFKVFVQSTSVNRKLNPGTAVVRLPNTN